MSETTNVTTWIEFDDPVDEGWKVKADLNFLASSYGCVYKNGCKGAFDDSKGAEPGCCRHGFYMNGDEDYSEELAKVTEHVERLTPDQWENHGKRWLGRVGNDGKGLVHNGMCIFHNRKPGKEGCALHAAALEAGEDPIDWKPYVCNIAPIGIDYDTETYTTVIGRFMWGNETVEERSEYLDWWCDEDEVAYVYDTALYVRMEKELRIAVGDPIYEMLRDAIQAQFGTSPAGFASTFGPDDVSVPIKLRRKDGSVVI